MSVVLFYFVTFFLNLFVQSSKQLLITEVDPNLGMEDMLDDFVSFFIGGKKPGT